MAGATNNWHLPRHLFYPCRIIPSVQFSSVAQSCLTLCDPMNCSTPGLPVHHQLLEFTQTHVHQVGDAIQPSHPLSSPSPPPIPPSIRVFSNESTLHMRWPKYWSFSFSISPSKEHPGPISFRMDWLDNHMLFVWWIVLASSQHGDLRAVNVLSGIWRAQEWVFQQVRHKCHCLLRFSLKNHMALYL